MDVETVKDNEIFFIVPYAIQSTKFDKVLICLDLSNYLIFVLLHRLSFSV